MEGTKHRAKSGKKYSILNFAKRNRTYRLLPFEQIDTSSGDPEYHQ